MFSDFSLDAWGYFNRNKRITKSLLGADTIPPFLRLRLRLVDFLVKR